MAPSETTPGLLTSDPPSPLEREPALIAMLAEAERKVEEVIESMPTAFVDARRLIGRELWPLPRPEELQTIIKIASDREAVGPRRELPRRFLALRLVAEELTRAYWDPMMLDPGAIWCRAEDLRTVVEAVQTLEAQLEPGHYGSSEVAFEDRVYLRTVAQALAPRRDLIAAAVTLAHPLVEVLEVSGADDLPSRIPSLTQDEGEVLKRIVTSMQSSEAAPEAHADADVDANASGTSGDDASEEAAVDPGADPARRHIALEVLTVRWLIHGDVVEWEEIFREAAETQAQEAAAAQAASMAAAGFTVPATPLPAGAPAPAARPGESEPKAKGDKDDEDAIWVIEEDASGSEDPEEAPAEPQDAPPESSPAEGAAAASLSPSSLHLTSDQIERRVLIHKRALQHQILYAVVSERLQKIQDEALLSREKETTEWLAAFRRPLVASYTKLLTVVRNQIPGTSAAGDMIVPDDDPAETFDSIFEKAVTQVEEKKAEVEAERATLPAKRARKAYLKRLGLMAAAILFFGGIAVAVRFLIPKPPPDTLTFSPSEARNVISLSETRPIGTMLYAKLSGQWEPFSLEEREREVVSLARLATERGFSSIYLVNEAGEPLAEWDNATGVKLMGPAPEK